MDRSAQTELLRRYYAALNAKDFAALSEIFDPEIEWIEPSESPEGGIWRGRAAVVEHFEEGVSRWAEGSCESERFIPAGDRIISLERVHVRLDGQEDWVKGQLAAVFTIANDRITQGSITQGRIFWDRDEAFRWTDTEFTEE